MRWLWWPRKWGMIWWCSWSIDEQGWGWGRRPDEDGLHDDEEEDSTVLDGLIRKDEHEDEDQDDDDHENENEGKNGMRMDDEDNLAELFLMDWWTKIGMRMRMRLKMGLGKGWREPCRTAAPWRSCRCCPREGSTRRCTSHWEPPLKVVVIGDVLNVVMAIVSSSLSLLFS